MISAVHLLKKPYRIKSRWDEELFLSKTRSFSPERITCNVSNYKYRCAYYIYGDAKRVGRNCSFCLIDEFYRSSSKWRLCLFSFALGSAREPTIDAILIHRACPSTCNDIIGSHPHLLAPPPLLLLLPVPTACSVRHNFSGMLHSARCCSAALTFHLFLSRYAVGMPRNITYLLVTWPIYMRKSSSFDGYWSRRGRMPISCGMHRDAKSKAIYADPREI